MKTLKAIEDDMIEPYPNKLWNVIETKLSSEIKSLKKFEKLFIHEQKEIIRNYDEALRKAIFYYVLSDKTELHRLRMHAVPQPFPPILIRAPIPWHSRITVSRHYLYHNLFVCHQIAQSLRQLWHQKYLNFFIKCTVYFFLS